MLSGGYVNILIGKLLFFWVTWFYIFVNFLIAYFAQISTFLLIARDFWILIFLVLLVHNKRYFALTVLFTSFLVSFHNWLFYYDFCCPFSFLYGLRSFIFIIFIVEAMVLVRVLSPSKNNLKLLFGFISLVAILQFISSNIFKSTFINDLFNISEYFSNKGVSSYLEGGFFGDRVSVPLYSPALIATFILSYLIAGFFKNRFIKIISLVVSFLTLSKVFFVFVALYFSKKYWKIIAIISLIGLIFIHHILLALLDIIDPGIVSRHLSSTFIHLNSVVIFIERFFESPFGYFVGYNSTYHFDVFYVDGVAHGIESLFFFIFADLGLLSILLVLYLIRSYMTLCCDQMQLMFVFFVIIGLFSALSNHPIAFIPGIMAVFYYQARNHGS